MNNIPTKYTLGLLKNAHPGFSIDCVIFSFYDDKLKVLLNKFELNDKWMLPGGFMGEDEDVDAAAYRILNARTGIHDLYLKQFYLFGSKNRTNIEENRQLLLNYKTEKDGYDFMTKRFVSIGYFSFVKYDNVVIEDRADDISKWFDIDSIPLLYSDHNFIIEKAIETIRLSVGRIPIGSELLPGKFTITELRKIYEGFLGRELDRRNFQKKMLQANLIIKLDERKEVNTYPRPILFAFNREKIQEAELL